MDRIKKPFYGWAIVSAGALGNSLQGGFIFWSMGMYTSAFEDFFDATRRDVTLIETCVSVSVNIMFPLVGWWVDKRSARHLVALGTVSLGTGLCLISVAGTLLHIWIVFATLIPLGVLSVGVLPSSALISRWFEKKRGLGLGISVAGSSLGGFLAPPVVAFLLLTQGWRTAFWVIGVGIILLAPLFYYIVANYPEDKGLKQLAADPETKHPTLGESEPNWSFAELLRCPTVYLQAIVSGSLLGITLGMLANLSLHAKDLGFGTQQTALLYSIIAACSFGGKIVFGTIIDRIGTKKAGFLTISLMATAMLIFLSGESFQIVLSAALVLGLAIGGVSPLWTSLVAFGFGAKSFGRAIGVQNTAHIPITAPIAPIAGHISDTTSSYQLVFIGFLGMLAFAAIALFFLQRPVHRSLK